MEPVFNHIIVTQLSCVLFYRKKSRIILLIIFKSNSEIEQYFDNNNTHHMILWAQIKGTRNISWEFGGKCSIDNIRT